MSRAESPMIARHAATALARIEILDMNTSVIDRRTSATTIRNGARRVCRHGDVGVNSVRLR
jgi:hypothetical protein